MSLTVYKSSAGSGKTFTLVKEYLKIALKNANASGLKSILALTFTNKAALEMRDRIIKYLNELTDDKLHSKSDMYRILLADKYLNLSEEELISRSNKLLHQLLHQYSSFSVSTIDRFSHSVIRTFSNELGLSQNFEVTLEIKEILLDAIENLIGRAGKEKELTDFLIRFSLDRIENDKSWKIEDEIFNSSQFILNEDAEEYLKPLSELSLTELSAIQKKLLKSVAKFENSLIEDSENALKLISDSGLEIKDFYFGATGGLPSYFKKLIRLDFKKLEGARVLKTIDEDVWYTSKTMPDVAAKIDSIKDELVSYYAKTKKLIQNDFPIYVIETGVLSNFYATSLINEVYREFKRLKVERNVLPVSDFNKLISSIVSEQEAPYIYERIGNHFNNFLIDEFQDTSRLQWQNLVPLIENSLATGNSNLVVGDGKQAIYRWRGGEVEQFVKFPYIRGMENSKILSERIENIRLSVKEFKLGTNYRSKKNIVEFNNRLFSNIVEGKEDIIKSIYKEINQKCLPQNEGGYVEVKVKDEKDENGESFDEFNLRQTIIAIEAAIKQGYNYGDIAILTRKNPSLLYLADELSSQGIPIVSPEVLLVNKSPKVRLLNTYLKLLLNPNDRHEQLRFLFLLKRVHEIDVDPFPLAQSIMKDTTKENFILIVGSLGFEISLEQSLTTDAYEIMEQGIVELKMNARPDDYLLAYLNVAHEYFLKNGVSLSGFLRYFEENNHKFNLALPESINAVKLLTIHKAKGLEFPVVIFPFANYKYNFQRTMWVSFKGEIEGLPSFKINKNRDLALTSFSNQMEMEDTNAMLDELNIFYVVCTRAVDQLHIITSKNGRNKNFSALFLPTLEKMDSWKGELSFSYGKKQYPKKEDNESDKILETQLSSMHSYPELKRFNYLFPEKNETQEKEINARRFGEWLHYSMANIISLKDLDSAIKRTVTKFQIKQETSDLLLSTISGMLQNPKIASFFDADEVKTEVEFINDKGKIIRPDRVVVLNGQRIVIDYKTGKELEEHKIQILEYRDVISQVYKEPVLARLIYTENAKLVEVL